MKIAVIGSAPSSVKLAPFGNPEWIIYACSPAVYPQAPRVDVWFELHRWEPGEVGKPETQKTWLSPEYVQWMAKQKDVVMTNPVPEIPNSRAIPWQHLVRKYGAYNFTSSLAYMTAMAIDAISDDRALRDADEDGPRDQIGIWGVDMSAHEEYGYQRSGMQFFIQLAANLNIDVILPPESDLLQHPPLYGVSESWGVHIKLMQRQRELSHRVNLLDGQIASATREKTYLQGALDDVNYMMGTWINVEGNPAFNVSRIIDEAKLPGLDVSDEPEKGSPELAEPPKMTTEMVSTGFEANPLLK